MHSLGWGDLSKFNLVSAWHTEVGSSLFLNVTLLKTRGPREWWEAGTLPLPAQLILPLFVPENSLRKGAGSPASAPPLVQESCAHQTPNPLPLPPTTYHLFMLSHQGPRSQRPQL
jgi:hypothetical protein